MGAALPYDESHDVVGCVEDDDGHGCSSLSEMLRSTSSSRIHSEVVTELDALSCIGTPSRDDGERGRAGVDRAGK